MIDKVKYWVELSDYDLVTAEAKAYYLRHYDSTPPYSHSLTYLAEKSGILEELTEQQLDFINSVEPMNIEARYPSHKQELFKSLSKEKCEEMIKQTKEFQQWVKMKL